MQCTLADDFGGSSVHTDGVRECSRYLYKNRYMLEISAAIASLPDSGAGATFYARQVSKMISGPADNQVAAVIHRLAAAGLLEEIGKIGQGNHVYYRRKTSSAWDAACTLLREFQGADVATGEEM